MKGQKGREKRREDQNHMPTVRTTDHHPCTTLLDPQPSPPSPPSPVPSFPSPRVHQPEGGCDRSDVVVVTDDEVLELATPSAADKAPVPGEGCTTEEENVPRGRGCWTDDRPEGNQEIIGELGREVLRQWLRRCTPRNRAHRRDGRTTQPGQRDRARVACSRCAALACRLRARPT